MSNRFPISDEQVIKPKNTMEDILKRIDKVQEALEGYNRVVELEFHECNKESLEKFAKQEGINFMEPDEFSRYYFSIWEVGNVKVYFRTKELKIKSIIFEDEN